jgi:hypothetical protein
LETRDDVNALSADYHHCEDTARMLGQGQSIHFQGRFHQVDPNTKLVIQLMTGRACADESPLHSGGVVELGDGTLTGQTVIEVAVPGPFSFFTETTLLSSVVVVLTVVRTGGPAPYSRRLTLSLCACVIVP